MHSHHTSNTSHDWHVAHDSMTALGLHAALQDMVRYKRKLFAIKGQFCMGFKQGLGHWSAISRDSLYGFVILGVDCISSAAIESLFGQIPQ